MRRDEILHRYDFTQPSDAWDFAPSGTPWVEPADAGAVLDSGPGESVLLNGGGLHTRNGDRIELRFRPLEPGAGWLRFGFDAEQHEYGRVEINWEEQTLSFWTSDWRREHPIAKVHLPATQSDASRTLVIAKSEAGGDLIRNADVTVFLDGEQILLLEDLDMLPEMGVVIEAGGSRVLIEEFCHRGTPSGIPEYLDLGGYQVLNIDSIEANLDSIKRGLVLAAEAGTELLVTPEMSLTGLHRGSSQWREPGPVAAAEAEVRRFIRELPNAPFSIVGLPVWTPVAGHEPAQTRFIASRVYDPDGEIYYTALKVHAAEHDTWHGYRLNEFDINGVPISLHICHDHRYPQLQILPVMFGCRLLLHPSNGGRVGDDVSREEGIASTATKESHAFYMNLNAGGGSYIAGPQRGGNLIAVSDEWGRENPDYPATGELQECFLQSRLRVHDAFGYWPMRAFRTSESVARAYVELYREMGGVVKSRRA